MIPMPGLLIMGLVVVLLIVRFALLKTWDRPRIGHGPFHQAMRKAKQRQEENRDKE